MTDPQWGSKQAMALGYIEPRIADEGTPRRMEYVDLSLHGPGDQDIALSVLPEDAISLAIALLLAANKLVAT